jgi:serpin B
LKIVASLVLIVFLIIASISLYEILSDEEDKLEPLNFSSKILLERGATTEGINDTIYSYNQFAFSLYQEITSETDENVFFSPFSTYIALSMIYEGANGETADEMADVLYISGDNEIRRASFAQIQNNLNNRKAKCTLKLSNNFWVQEGLQVKDNFRDIIDNYYFSEMEEINFMNDPEKSRESINQRVEKETGGKIKNLLPPGSIDLQTIMTLTNAIYFKGEWKHAFEKENTEEEIFFLEDNQTKMVPMMNLNSLGYKNVDINLFTNYEIQVLELPYRGDTISMFIFLPITFNFNRYEPRSIDELENELSLEYYTECIKELSLEDSFNVELPKFSYASEYNLKNTLNRLGMNEAFNSSADFNGITDEFPLFIDEVYHKASISVNEKGTEATAATGTTAPTGYPPEFIADHPFFFTIQDKETGLILFMGRLMDPLD